MSRQDRFDRADFERAASSSASGSAEVAAASAHQASEKPIWPILGLKRDDVGDTVMEERRGRPHRGIDIHAPAGTSVVAARSGTVLRVVDGRRSKRTKLFRAGLFVDVLGYDGLIYRYLHLNETSVAAGTSIRQGQTLGTVAPSRRRPHLHFEIRRADYAAKRGDYGAPINPLRVLPRLDPAAA